MIPVYGTFFWSEELTTLADSVPSPTYGAIKVDIEVYCGSGREREGGE